MLPERPCAAQIQRAAARNAVVRRAAGPAEEQNRSGERDGAAKPRRLAIERRVEQCEREIRSGRTRNREVVEFVEGKRGNSGRNGLWRHGGGLFVDDEGDGIDAARDDDAAASIEVEDVDEARRRRCDRERERIEDRDEHGDRRGADEAGEG